jgi:predicted GH43/DUF377 family glycosyl hydrolase
MKKAMARGLFFFILFCLSDGVFGQSEGYKDGRPAVRQRISCEDQGIVLRYGDGRDSCDVFGAREALINKAGDTYYLFYDGAGKDGWKACLAESKNLTTWSKKGPILEFGEPGTKDAKCVAAPWVIRSNNTWHMFYFGSPNTTPAPYRIPAFPYSTMKAKATSLAGPWIKQYDVIPFSTKEGSFYSVTASPGFIVKNKDVYMQFFSAAMVDSSGIKRTLGIARTKDLDGAWIVDDKPIFPSTEQVENSSLYYQKENTTWFLFTNHVGINSSGIEYTDAVWVFWTKDLNKWDSLNSAVVLDSSNCKWSKGVIGMPTVIRCGNKLALLYDGFEGHGIGHMQRNIGLAWIFLPIKTPEL